jgi:hypothetical protein
MTGKWLVPAVVLPGFAFAFNQANRFRIEGMKNENYGMIQRSKTVKHPKG